MSDWSSDVCSSDLRARTPSVASRLDELLVDAYGDLRCTAAGAASISAVIDTEHTLRQLTRLLRSAETAAVVIPKAIFEGPDGRYLSGTFGFSPGEFAEYPEFPQFAPTERSEEHTSELQSLMRISYAV